MAKALIRMGDMTTHGGKVLEGFSDYTIQGIPVAGVGHKTICPLCKGVFPIIQGYGGITVNGVFVALDGHVTACGAKLIPSQHEEVVDEDGGDVTYVSNSMQQNSSTNPKTYDQHFTLHDEITGEPLVDVSYKIVFDDGHTIEERTDMQGRTVTVSGEQDSSVTLHVFEEYPPINPNWDDE